MDPKDLMLQIPAWGLFAILVMKLVFDFIGRRDQRRAAEEATAKGVPEVTVEGIKAVMRDQDERKEIIDSLRSQAVTQSQLATTMETMSRAQAQMATTLDRNNALAERAAQRQRAVAESIETSRLTMNRLATSVAVLQRDNERILQRLEIAPLSQTDELTPVQVPIPTRPR